MPDTESRLRELEVSKAKVEAQQDTIFHQLDEIKDELKDLRKSVDEKFDSLVTIVRNANTAASEERSREREALAKVLARVDSLEDHRKSVMRVLWGAVSTSLGAAILWFFKS